MLVQAAPGAWSCVVPGLAVTFSGADVSHAMRGQTLCVAWGVLREGAAAPGQIAPRVTAEHVRAALEQDGESALEKLGGGYALVFIDAARGRVILSVDRFSIETVCFGVRGARLAFSDRLDTMPVDQAPIAAQSVYDYLHFHCVPAPATIEAGVERLVRGTHAVVERGEVACRSHWQPRFAGRSATPLRELCAEFRALVQAAVHAETLGEPAVGCFLSGGTDSSTVAGMLARAGGTVRTYSIGFDAAGYDEMAYARIAARHFGTEHHEYYLTPADVTAAIPPLAAFCDQPFGNSSLVPAYYCARQARADGVTRMLAGDGGDELFGGNSRYALQLFLALYDHLPATLRNRFIEPIAGNRALARVPGVRQLTGYVRHSRVPMPDRMETFNLLSAVGAANVLSPALLSAVDAQAPMEARRRAYAEARAPHVLDRMLFYDWKFTLADSDLPKVRTATSAAGTSVGYPFLAAEIADFSLRLPARWKVSGYRLRWFFKYALRGFLPTAILRKKKHGFGLPFGTWALAHAPLRELASDSLAGLERRGILRTRFRDELMGVLLPSNPRYYGELVWILMMLEQWLHAHGRTVPLEREAVAQGAGTAA